jgi:pimeloyl-[acyl-carrier protein] methyl ester esterase
MLYTVTRPGFGPPFVLVHGWTCDHRSMFPVADAFPGRAAVLPDLPGHGQSHKTTDYSIASQAEAVLVAAPDQAIWIGHSMGAQITVEAAARAPGRILAAVLLDPAQIAPMDAAFAFRDRMAADLAATQDLPALMRDFSSRMIVRAADPPATAALAECQAAIDPDVARAGWNAIWRWDGATALAAALCPLLVVTVERTMNRLADLARLNRRVSTGQVTGSGHMLQYEVMDQVAPMIRRFLDLNGLLSPGS